MSLFSLLIGGGERVEMMRNGPAGSTKQDLGALVAWRS